MWHIELCWTTVFMFVLSLYLGWNIGANDAANCVGPAVGARILSVRKGMVLVALFVFLGALLQGGKTIKTMGNIAGIRDIDFAVFAVLLGASLVLSFLTWRGVPVSTTFAVLGATVGVSLLIKQPIFWGTAAAIFVCGLLTPLASLILAFFFHKLVRFLMHDQTSLLSEARLKWVIVCGALFMSYSLGANNVGNSMGLLVDRGLLLPVAAGFLGGFAIAVGALTMGKRVVLTVGKEISILDPVSAFSASVGAGLCLYILALAGIPTSSSFAIVGSVAGVGIAHSTSMVNPKVLKMVVKNWIFCPFVSALSAILIYMMLRTAFGA